MSVQLTNYIREWLAEPDEISFEIRSMLWLESENLLTPGGQAELQNLRDEFPELLDIQTQILPDETTSSARPGFTIIRGASGLQSYRGSRRVDSSLYQMARSTGEPVARIEQQLDGECGRISIIVQEDVGELWSLTISLQTVSPGFQGQSLTAELVGFADTTQDLQPGQEINYDGLSARQYGIEIVSDGVVVDFFPVRFGEARE